MLRSGNAPVPRRRWRRLSSPAAQNYPDELLPDALKNANPLNLMRLLDGEMTQRQLSGSSVL
ncbi:hypothetical protein [Paraburkholderia fungorum]|uniref:hypothetical protein n=1 Tax=Paraburkholderia fungorum TaxID=134537 RepID=UPI000627423D